MSAEPKRVSFMTIDSTNDFSKKSEKDTASGVGKKNSFRLEIDLFEPDEYKFPDYNYKKLLFIEKKKQKKISKISNGTPTNTISTATADDPFGDNDDDVTRIAKEMEAKYGAGSSYSTSKTKTVEYDRGIGYDENDSFIDNAEAYDEIIPEDIETDRGGFYVNSGLLEFKKMPNFERPGDEIRMPKAKKRALSTTSESEGETNQNQASISPVKAKKKKANDEKKVKSATASSSSDEQGRAAKKAKKEKKEILPPVKEIKEAKDIKEIKEVKKQPVSVANVVLPGAAAVVPEDDSKKQIKTTTVKDMLRLKRDNLAKKMEAGKSSSGTNTTTDNDEDDGSESVSSLAVSESSHESNVEAPQPPGVNGSKELTLPSTFAPELIQSITSLKNYAETTAKNNANFFDNQVKEQLLKIDGLAKLQGSSIQVQVYKQLEIFIPCPKKTILSKVNRFRTQKSEGSVKAQVKKLKMAVNTIMPDLVRKYDEDLKEFEGKKNINHIIGTGSPLEGKGPRRRFHWNDNLRQILFDLSQSIAEFHKFSKSKKESLDDYFSKYLNDHVLPIWPEGWIKIEDFVKELERKKKREARSPQSTSNGKSQKTEMSMVNGKSPSSHQSVIKKASDHSINSIMSSTSPSPPLVSQHSSSKVQSETPKSSKTQVIELEKLSSASELLKVSQPKTVPKYIQPPPPQEVVKTEKTRISDGSDSDCAIIESPIKTPMKPQQQPTQQQPHSNNNNNKIIHSTPTAASTPSPQQPKENKKISNKKSDDYSTLINSFEMLTGNKKDSSMNSPYSLSNPLTSPSSADQRKMNTSHGINGINEVPQMKAATKSYSNNLQYAINDIITTTMMKGKGNAKSSSSDYQKQYTTSMTNSCLNIVQNVSVITSTTDVGKSNSNTSFVMPPVLNLSNKK